MQKGKKIIFLEGKGLARTKDNLRLPWPFPLSTSCILRRPRYKVTKARTFPPKKSQLQGKLKQHVAKDKYHKIFFHMKKKKSRPISRYLKHCISPFRNSILNVRICLQMRVGWRLESRCECIFSPFHSVTFPVEGSTVLWRRCDPERRNGRGGGRRRRRDKRTQERKKSQVRKGKKEEEGDYRVARKTT